MEEKKMKTGICTAEIKDSGNRHGWWDLAQLERTINFTQLSRNSLS
jgi:hypothetical protein